MPDNTRKLSLYILFTAAVALAFFLGAFFYFNRGSYSPPPSPNVRFEQFTQTTSVDGPSQFVDTPRMSFQRGLVLVDAAHRNAFDQGEILTLLSRIADRGYEVEFVGEFTLIGDDERIPLLEENLRHADSFVIILPREPYKGGDNGVVRKFIERGGKVLLIADPTRPHEINSVAESLGLEFQPDYLFNQSEYDLNFQHIFVRDFQPDKLTSGLDEITLYTAGSVQSSGGGLAFADANTESSVTGKAGPRYPLAIGENRNVLAIFDLTFMIPPHNASLDNDQLISNIADYLTDSGRAFELGDFPSFFKNDVEILLGDPELFSAGTKLKSDLSGRQIQSELKDLENLATDTVFLGLYESAPQVIPYLASNRIVVGDTLSIPSAADIPVENTAVIALHRSQGRYVLVVLSDSPEGLDKAIDLLISGDFRTGLVDELVGVYKTE